MATKTTGWKCTHSASVIAQTDTTATIRVYAYWQNNGWEYDIDHVDAYVYCNSVDEQVLSDGSVNNDTADNSNTYVRTTLGHHDFEVNKTTSSQNIPCYAKITSRSSYVSGTNSSEAANVSVSAKTSYAIKYNANGGSGAPGNQTKWHGTDLTLSSTKPTRTGYSFQGWSTANDSSVEYAAGAKYTANAGVTLYAVWKANTYTVKYDANGGSGAPGNQTKTYGVNLTLSTTKPTRANYKFLGWATTSTATTATYAAGGTFTTNAATTLYAVWELAYVKPDIYNVTVERYAFDGTNYSPSDNGKYALVSFEYRCFETITSVLEIKIEWENSSKTEAGFVTVDATDPNGSITEYIGENTLNADSTYTIRIIVRDNVDYSVYFMTLDGSNIPVDVLMDDAEGPKGVSFGKPAELEGKADFGYEIYPRNGIANILLEPETDLNNVLTPNTYIGDDVTTYNYANCPVTSGKFSLKVEMGSLEGTLVQTINDINKFSCCYWRRVHYVSTGWQDWYMLNIGEDTGWIDCNYTDKFTRYNDVYPPLQVRRIGNIVHLRGVVKPTELISITGDYFVSMASFDKSMAPIWDERFISQGSSANRFVLQISKNGTVDISRYTDSTAFNEDIPAGAWLNCFTTWFIG